MLCFMADALAAAGVIVYTPLDRREKRRQAMYTASGPRSGGDTSERGSDSATLSSSSVSSGCHPEVPPSSAARQSTGSFVIDMAQAGSPNRRTHSFQPSHSANPTLSSSLPFTGLAATAPSSDETDLVTRHHAVDSSPSSPSHEDPPSPPFPPSRDPSPSNGIQHFFYKSVFSFKATK